MLSMTSRLLLAATLVLALFLGLTGYALDRAFRDSAQAAVRDRLQGEVFALIAAAYIEENGGVRMPKSLNSVPFMQFKSELLARIVSNDRQHDWHSLALHDQADLVPLVTGLSSTESRFQLYQRASGKPLFVFSFGVAWDQRDARRESYTFTVAESTDDFDNEVRRFRHHLGGWLGGVGILLLAVQSSILRWGLAPLRAAADDLAAIEAGEHMDLQGAYPRELRGLTDNLNALIRGSRDGLERYRNSLADLAHSLNTPLALLRGAVELTRDAEELRKTVREQVDRMSDIVNYQLQRAATSGRRPLTAPVSVVQVADKIRATLDKVYMDRRITCRVLVGRDAVFHGDEGDLYELLGNLMDNAYKWCKSGVVVVANAAFDGALELSVEDDGNGIAADSGLDITERGVRADTATRGHGIGLAMVRNIVQVYGGRLEIGDSLLGGARLKILLPES